jgi:hypothetical protein
MYKWGNIPESAHPKDSQKGLVHCMYIQNLIVKASMGEKFYERRDATVQNCSQLVLS